MLETVLRDEGSKGQSDELIPFQMNMLEKNNDR